MLVEASAGAASDLAQVAKWIGLYEEGKFALFPNETVVYDFDGQFIDYDRFTRKNILTAHGLVEMEPRMTTKA